MIDDTPENREKIKLSVRVRQINEAIIKVNNFLPKGKEIELIEGVDFSEDEIKEEILAKFEK